MTTICEYVTSENWVFKIVDQYMIVVVCKQLSTFIMFKYSKSDYFTFL